MSTIFISLNFARIAILLISTKLISKANGNVISFAVVWWNLHWWTAWQMFCPIVVILDVLFTWHKNGSLQWNLASSDCCDIVIWLLWVSKCFGVVGWVGLCLKVNHCVLFLCLKSWQSNSWGIEDAQFSGSSDWFEFLGNGADSGLNKTLFW